MYRVRQFFWALGARMSPAAWVEIKALLTPEQVDLFRRMPRYDQRHSLRVMHTLRAAGHRQPELLAAALLHDVAKSSGPLRLWHRVAIVLLRAVSPRWLARLSREVEPGHWRYPFCAHRKHAEIGARWAASAGCSPLAVWLIAHHQSTSGSEPGEPENPGTPLLAALRWADDQN